MRNYAMEMVLSNVTAPGGVANINLAQCQGVASAPQSLAIRSTKAGVKMLSPWSNNQVTGGVRIRSNRMHDTSNCIYERIIAGQTYPFAGRVPNTVYSQDTIQVSQFGSAVGGQIEQTIIPFHYEQLDGISANLLRSGEVIQFRANGSEAGKENVSVDVTCAGILTGLWGGGVALNNAAVVQALIPNRYYAVLGMNVDTRCCGVGFQSTEIGNLRVAVPGEPNNKDLTSEFFMNLSDKYNLPCVPIVNSAGLGNAIIDIGCNQAGGNFIVSVHLVLLNANFNPAQLI